MNNRCYRVIFSKAKGMLVVVSEATRSQGKSSNASVGGSDNNISKVGSQTSYYGKYAAISASILISLGLAMPTQTVAETKIVADKSAPSSQQATILNTASGKVQVNIQTPSAAGVSRNTFSQFDVDKDGAILNNSRTNTQTKLAGWVEGNPWLARGSANVILNEVNSSNPSILNGYTEIAGQKADLVIANPAGIQVQGGGFINSNRTTLTTGNPNLNNEGGLTGFNIDKGNIKIDGDLDDNVNGGSNYTQIISKTAQINAGIYSQNLDVITGENEVSYSDNPEDTQVTNTSTNSNQQTGVAIDVSSLGGMYANRIRLIGTQKGMGVTNAGNVNAADTLKLDVDGNLVNSGTLGATNTTSIDLSNNQVNNSGTISSSKKTISIESDSLTNSGVINSYDKTTLDQNTAINNSGLISAGALDVDAKTLDNTGRIEQTGTGKLSLETDTLNNTEQAVIGQSLYEDQPKATTPTLDEAPTSATGGTIISSGKPVDLTGGDNNNSDPQTPTPTPEPTPEPLPPVTADGSIKVDTLNNTGSNAIITANGVIDGKANQTTNTGKSSIALNNFVTDNSQTNNKVINTGSRIQLNQQIDWDLQTFSNESGQITTKSDANINTDSDINNTKGKLISQGDMTLTAAGDLNNTSGVIQGNNTALKNNNLDNTEGSINATGKLDIDSNGDLTNQKGSIRSANDLAVKSTNLSNTGQIYSGGNADIDATENLTNSGLIGAKGNNSIDANTINNTGDFVAGMNTDGSLVKEKADLIVTGQDSLTSSGNHIATGTAEFTSKNTDLTDSNTQAGTINFISESDISTAGANITATDTLTLQTKGSINNQGGSLTAEDLNISADSLDNTKGSISQTGAEDLELSLANGINNTEGTLQANADTLSIDTNELTNAKGTISHAGETALTIDADKVDNSEGKVLSLAQQTWTVAETVNNSKGVVQAASFDMNLDSLNNTDGNVLAVNNEQEATAANTLTVAKTLNNTNGNINSTTGTLALDVGNLNNTEGTIKASDDLTVDSKQLTNSGTIYSEANTQITNKNGINNSGSIAAQGNTSISTGSLEQTGEGQLIAGLTPTGELAETDNNLTVTATGDVINSGLNLATGDASFIATDLDLTGSTNQADNINLTATESDVSLDNATTIASKKVAVSAATLSNNQGKMQAEAYELNINKLSNREGSILQTGEEQLTITANQGVDNTQGTIATPAALAINSNQAVNNSEGIIQAASTDIDAGSLINQQGTIATTEGNLNIDSQNAVNNQSGVISAAGVSINSTGDINNSEGLIAQTDTEQTLEINTTGMLSNQNTKDQADSQKGILANGSASIESDSLNNQSGLISANTLEVTVAGADAVDNSQGSMTAVADLTVIANNASLNNQGGRIASNNTTLDIEDSIDNNAANSLIQANNDVNIKTGTLNNQNTKQAADSDKTQGIIAGNDATINTGALNNQSGQIIANNVLDVDAKNSVNNDQGNLLSGSRLEINADAYSNQNGTMSSDTLDIAVVQDITHTGESNLSANTLKLTTQGSFTNTDSLTAQNVSVAANSITNNKDAEIVSSDTTELTATTTLNNSGLINGSKTFIEAETATNHSFGRVYGDHVAIKAETLNNSPDTNIIKTEITKEECEAIPNCSIEVEVIPPNPEDYPVQDTGTIFGTTIGNTTSGPTSEWIEQNTQRNTVYYKVESDPAPVIAARERMDLGVTTLNNDANLARAGKFNSDFNGQASLISNGELHIGGDLDENHQATGSATTVNNIGATIQSGGDMVIKADTLNNNNADFTTQVINSYTDVVEYDLATNGSPIYSPDEVEITTGGHNNRIHDLRVLETGETYERYNRYTYTEVLQQEVTQTSDPSRIISGGSIELNLNEFNTNKSQIIGAGQIMVTGSSGTVEAEDSTVTPVISYDNANQYYNRRGTDCRVNGPFGACWGSYDVTDTSTISGYSKPDSRGDSYQLRILDIDIEGTPNTAVVLSNLNQATQTSIENNDVSSINSAINELNNLTNNNNGAEDTSLDSLQALVNAPNTLSDSQKQALQDILDAKANGEDITQSDIDSLINNLSEQIDNNQQVRTVGNQATLPNSSLYGINPDSDASFLIETDASFTDYRNWLSSDYMLDRLSLEPSNIHKRLGDGYYEQQMVRDQIVALTGQYYLGDYTSFDDQYKALMDAGITFANAYNLRPGIALTDAQIANLTTDIVWLEEQEVTLADGTTQIVLAPKVYTRRAADSLDGSGNLIAAKEVEMEFSGELTNRGSIIADDKLKIKTGTLTNANGGVIAGNYVAIKTEEDLNNIGSTMKADSYMSMDIGGDLNNISSTYESEAQNGKGTSERTGISKVATIYVGDSLSQMVDDDGKPIYTLVANVDGDVNFGAGAMGNQGGSTLLDVDGDVNLDSINVGYQTNAIGDSNNYYNQGQRVDVGSSVIGKGDVVVKADNINGTAARVSSKDGTTALIADNDIALKEGRNQQNLSMALREEESDFLYNKVTQDRYSKESDNSVTTNVTGNKVVIKSGNDTTLIGTNVISDTGTYVDVGNDLTIAAAKDTSSDSSSHYEKETGVMLDDGLSLTVGKKQQENQNKRTQVTHTSSMVGAEDGNVIINVGNQYSQIGSKVVAGLGEDSGKDITDANRGNVAVTAKDIDIVSVTNTSTSESGSKTETTGLTVSVTNGVVDSVNSIQNLADSAENTDNERMRGMAAVTAALKAKAMRDQVKKAAAAEEWKDLASVRVQATIGSQSSESSSQSSKEENQASEITANNLSLNATGGGKDSNIDVIGSDLTVTNHTDLAADNEINILGKAQNSSQSSSNSSEGWGAGVYAEVGAEQTGFGVTANANRGEGQGNGSSTTYANSHIDTKSFTMQSGGDANIIGGVVNTDRAIVDVGGDLTIQSLQDTATYDGEQKNVGFNADMDVAGGSSSSLTVNGGKTDINSNHQAVSEQSGIFTKDGGFKANVEGETTLIGGAVTTTEEAIAKGLNQFDSKGGIETVDIYNTSGYEGESASAGFSVSKSSNPLTTTGIGYGEDSESQTSVTKAGISGVAGNKGITTENQEEYAGIITDKFKEADVKEELDAQVHITQDFSKEAPKAVGDYSTKKRNELIAKGNIEEAKKWEEGGTYRVALHTLVSALGTGSIEGALAGGTTAVSVPVLDNYLKEQGLDDTSRKAVLLGFSAGVGATLGGDTASTVSTTMQTENNYLFHEEAIEYRKLLDENYECAEKGLECPDIQRQINLYNFISAARDKEYNDCIKSNINCSAVSKSINSARESYNNLTEEPTVNVMADFMDVADKAGGVETRRVGKITSEALVEIGKETITAPIAIGGIAIKAAIGDKAAQDQLIRVVEGLKHPIDTTVNGIKENFAEADKLEAQGDKEGADRLRLKTTMEIRLLVTAPTPAVALRPVRSVSKLGDSNTSSTLNKAIDNDPKSIPDSFVSDYNEYAEKHAIYTEDYNKYKAEYIQEHEGDPAKLSEMVKYVDLISIDEAYNSGSHINTGSKKVDNNFSEIGDYVLPTGRQTIDPTRTSFSQATVSYQKLGMDYNYDTIVKDMTTSNSWVGDPVDVVNMPDKAPTSVDNTRLLAAREAGVKVEANVHDYNDPIPSDRAEKLIYGGVVPKTWGEAIELRIKKQSQEGFAPENWSTDFPYGNIYDPEVTK